MWKLLFMKPRVDFYKILFEEFGPLIGGSDLAKVLGFRTSSAFNKSIREGRIDVDVFVISGRKGKFAYSNDIANWLEKIGPTI